MLNSTEEFSRRSTLSIIWYTLSNFKRQFLKKEFFRVVSVLHNYVQLQCEVGRENNDKQNITYCQFYSGQLGFEYHYD